MVYYDIVSHGLVWYCVVWYGMVWYGMVWCGMVWYVFALYCKHLKNLFLFLWIQTSGQEDKCYWYFGVMGGI